MVAELLMIRAVVSLIAALTFMFLTIRHPRTLYVFMGLECLVLLYARYHAIELGLTGSRVPFDLDLLVTIGAVLNLVIALECAREEYCDLKFLEKRKKELEEVVYHKE